MITHPTAEELAQALADFDSAPKDARQTFLARVADNARAILAREAEGGALAEAAETQQLAALLGAAGDHATLNRMLCQALREQRIDPRDPELLAHLRASVLHRIAIDQPTYWGVAALTGEP